MGVSPTESGTGLTDANSYRLLCVPPHNQLIGGCGGGGEEEQTYSMGTNNAYATAGSFLSCFCFKLLSDYVTRIITIF